MSTNKSSIRVRMYRHGLGDCFLLTFLENGKKCRMLIDCGVILGTKDAEAAMTAVAENILAETTSGGKSKIDIVAVTHEHWDHISGFVQAKPVFDKIEFGEVWVGWTEEPGNKIAEKLREEKGKKVKAIEKAVNKLTALDGAKWQGFNDSVRGLLEFEKGDLGAAATTSDAWKYILTKPPDKPRCFRPGGETYKIPGMDGFRIYVLGPPETEEEIKKIYTPKSETYHSFAGVGYEMGFYAAVNASADTNANAGAIDDSFADFAELALPFDREHQIACGDAENIPSLKASYYAENQKWRKIDDDWLAVSGELALNINSYTNNTCLALAIEFIEEGKVGKVMIFPGDAQFGNWMSWQNLEWEVDEKDGKKRKVTARELLENTVFYKVGHHGSHNATLKENGLELMLSPDLVAMIPVNREMAEKKKWKMPFDPLLKRLKEKARGRVIHADDPDKAKIKPDTAGLLSDAEWSKFDAALDDTNPLFVDYEVE